MPSPRGRHCCIVAPAWRRAEAADAKCAVVNFTTESAHCVRRFLHDILGSSQFLAVSAATYLGVQIGPIAMDTFWDKAMAKYAGRVHTVRHSAAHLRDKLAAYRLYGLSVLQLGHFALRPCPSSPPRCMQ